MAPLRRGVRRLLFVEQATFPAEKAGLERFAVIEWQKIQRPLVSSHARFSSAFHSAPRKWVTSRAATIGRTLQARSDASRAPAKGDEHPSDTRSLRSSAAHSMTASLRRSTMSSPLKIAPSILSADFGHLA